MIEPIQPTKRRKGGSAHAKLFGTGDLTRTMSCAVIVAHPADEVVGAGCLISKLVDVTVLHVTDGAPREMADLTKRITTFLQRTGADIVITHPYEGGHPDHDATAFATHTALRLMKENGLRPPALFEMALHPSEDFKAKIPEFLPGPERETTTLLLDERATRLKRQMLACFETQRASLAISPFGPEKFRQPSTYDFTTPPHDGKLHYENFNWAPSSDEWQTLASQALADLFPTAFNID